MKLLVLGGSGGCGAFVVRDALARGHAVSTIVRPAAAYDAPPGSTVVRDDVLRPGAIADAMRGCDAVISCLGIRRRHPRNPWSRLLSPGDFTARTAVAIVDAMRAARVTRVLAISAAGVADSARRMHPLLRLVFGCSRIGAAYRDLAAMEAIFAASGLDWTAARPVTLVDRAARPTREVDRFRLTATIARASVARWLVDELDRAGRASRTPMLAD